MHSEGPVILKVLDISTAHLTPATREQLNNDPTGETWPVSGRQIPYGYFIYAHDENPDGSIPDDLWVCIEYARKCGCSHPRFDADAEAYWGLPTYFEESSDA